MEDYRYHLRCSGKKNTPMLIAADEHLRIITLYKDSQAHLITHEEFQTLVANKEIRPPESWWGIPEGKLGIVHLSDFNKYSKTWENAMTAKRDFEAGWKACEKEHNLK